MLIIRNDTQLIIKDDILSDFGVLDAVNLEIKIGKTVYKKEIDVLDITNTNEYIVDSQDVFNSATYPEGLYSIVLNVTKDDLTKVVYKKCYFEDTTLFCKIAEMSDKHLAVQLQMHYYFLKNAHLCDCIDCASFEWRLNLINNELTECCK